jgi:hypothetical protein
VCLEYCSIFDNWLWWGWTVTFFFISAFFELLCILLYAYVFPRLQTVKYYRSRAAAEGSMTVAADLAAGGASSFEYEKVSWLQTSKKIYFTSELFFMDIGKTLTHLMLAGAGVTEILVHSYCLLSQEDCESRMLNFRVHMESSVCLCWDTPLYICRFSLLSPELMPPTQFFIPESLQCIATCHSSAYLCSTFTWYTLEGLSHLVWYGPFPTNGCRNVDLIITMNLLCIYEGFICICDLLANC